MHIQHTIYPITNTNWLKLHREITALSYEMHKYTL
jgi:hypothetical protein